MSAKQDKERRLEQIRRSCLICGNLHFNSAPCCDKSYCVSDLQRDFQNLQHKTINQNNGIDEFMEKLMKVIKYNCSCDRLPDNSACSMCTIKISPDWKNYTPKENVDKVYYKEEN